MAKKKGFNKYEIHGEITEIFLENNMGLVIGSTFVDTKNLQKLISANLSWHRDCYINNHTPYVTATEYYFEKDKKKSITHSLHGFLMNAERNGKYVDHRDHNTFNNLEQNLIVTSQSNNLKNRKGKNINNTSGHRDVSWIRGYWRVQLQVGGKNHMFPEKFEDADLAGKFAEQMRTKYYDKHRGNE